MRNLKQSIKKKKKSLWGGLKKIQIIMVSSEPSTIFRFIVEKCPDKPCLIILICNVAPFMNGLILRFKINKNNIFIRAIIRSGLFQAI